MLRFILSALTLWVVLPREVHAARTVAITYFDNNTNNADLAPLAKGLADMLITDLSHVSSLQIVERERLNQVLSELKLAQVHDSRRGPEEMGRDARRAREA